MQRLKKTLSLRGRRESVPVSSAAAAAAAAADEEDDIYRADERRVRKGACSFMLQYLGCAEVFESRGIHVCEAAIKELKEKNRMPRKTVILNITGETLKVVDETTTELILDQIVEKVSFCSPDRTNDRGFAFICRDSAAKRWVCHAFLALKATGERVSYAVGFAFNVCMELRMQKEILNDPVALKKSLHRSGSFKASTMTERREDPQSVIIADPIPQKKVSNLYSTQRPRPPLELLQKQGTLEGYAEMSSPPSAGGKKGVTLPSNDPRANFKRQMSLKIDSLTENIDRVNSFSKDDHGTTSKNANQDLENVRPVDQDNPWGAKSCKENTSSVGPETSIKGQAIIAEKQEKSRNVFRHLQEGATNNGGEWKDSIDETDSKKPPTRKSPFQFLASANQGAAAPTNAQVAQMLDKNIPLSASQKIECIQKIISSKKSSALNSVVATNSISSSDAAKSIQDGRHTASNSDGIIATNSGSRAATKSSALYDRRTDDYTYTAAVRATDMSPDMSPASIMRDTQNRDDVKKSDPIRIVSYQNVPNVGQCADYSQISSPQSVLTGAQKSINTEVVQNCTPKTVHKDAPIIASPPIGLDKTQLADDPFNVDWAAAFTKRRSNPFKNK